MNTSVKDGIFCQLHCRRQPDELNRLVPWLSRELLVLLNYNESYIAFVLDVIMDALTRYDIRSPELRNILRPYFHMHTEHFVHELLNFARTNFDLVGYDQSVTYLPRGPYLTNAARDRM